MKRIYPMLALMALTLILALESGFLLYFRLLSLMALVLGASLLWAFLSLRGVHVTVQRTLGRLQVGGSLESRVTIRNGSPLPKLGIELEDLSELPGHVTGAVVNLSPFGELRLAWRTPLRKRGIYSVGTPVVSSRDPFGIVRLRQRGPGTEQLVVFPLTVDIPPFSPPQGEPVGDGTIQRSAPATSTSVSTVREYQPGESSTHIHWPSTARTGVLMLKQFDSGMEDSAWILLDLQKEVHAGGEVENTEEYAVTAAASIAKNYSERGWAIGLMAHGDRQYILPPQDGAQALERVLLALTEARGEGNLSLRRLLGFWQSQTSSSTVSLVVITPSVDPAWAPMLESLAQRGASASVVLVDPGSFGGSGSPQHLPSRLHRRGIPTYVLRMGENISQSLQRPWRLPLTLSPADEDLEDRL